jgi:hypothetical protein
MTGAERLRSAIGRLDRDTLRAVAIALAEMRARAPDMADLEVREAVSLIIARAATEAQAWFWRGVK